MINAFDEWTVTPIASDAPICQSCAAASLRCAEHVARGYCERCAFDLQDETRYASEGWADPEYIECAP